MAIVRRVFLLPVFAAVCAATLSSTTLAAPERPRLGVLVVFDQLPSWLLRRAEPLFGPGGFGGLDGASLDVDYSYDGTETGPGHATLATCADPAVHGIATNRWYEGTKRIYVVDDDAKPLLGVDASSSKQPGRSARQLRAPTLGDAMRIHSDGRAHVVALSHKDRAAILSAGRSADLAVWYEPALGRYTTSTAYVASLPPWLEQAGTTLPARARAEGTWSPLPTPTSLRPLLPDDDRPGEGALAGEDRTFPHDLRASDDDKKNKLYRLSPQSMGDLFALSLRAVDEMQLGQDAEPDLLIVSVSTTDVVGHNYGGDSLEALDMLRRADLELRAFVHALDERLGGPSHLVVAVTSDHGATPLRETMARAGYEMPQPTYGDVTRAAELAVQRALPGSRKRVLEFLAPQLFVDTTELPDADVERVLAAVREGVGTIPGVASVVDVRPGRRSDDPYFASMRASSAPGRSAPLYVRPEPGVVIIEDDVHRIGADHGTPYVDDRRVPLLLRGPGVRRGRYATRNDARDVAPTLAFLLGVPEPELCTGKPVSAVGE